MLIRGPALIDPLSVGVTQTFNFVHQDKHIAPDRDQGESRQVFESDPGFETLTDLVKYELVYKSTASPLGAKLSRRVH